MNANATTRTYTASVVDRLTGETIYTCRPCTTWEEAHRRAEKHAKGDRYTIADE
jgi:predicted SprT family Zn-dependent metalloprotease